MPEVELENEKLDEDETIADSAGGMDFNSKDDEDEIYVDEEVVLGDSELDELDY